MLKKHTQLFEFLFSVSDLIVVSLAWCLSFWLRFESGLFVIDKGVPEQSDYLKIILFILLIWPYFFRRSGLYKPMRGSSRFNEFWKVIRGNTLCVISLLAVTYLFHEKNVPFSRLVFLVFWFCSTSALLTSRFTIRQFLRNMRRRGYNLRHVLVVGSGELAEKIASGMEEHPEYGTVCVGCLGGDSPPEDNSYKKTLLKVVGGADSVDVAYDPLKTAFNRHAVEREMGIGASHRIIGHYEDLPSILNSYTIDSVIIALPLTDHEHMEKVVSMLSDEMVDVRVVPDMHKFIRLGSEIEDFDGLPIVSLSSTPIYGINRFIKRFFDIFFGLIFLIISLPAIILTAFLLKISTRGSVFFVQERVGLDGQSFRIFKFRTMHEDAEKDGAKFAVKGDNRVTPLGGFLRRFNIDELPQLLNVVFGQMSLVGPRPERPVFIKEFRKNFPSYMLRHKVQAGMTGWAQVNGWRGNTSIEKRIEHDLYYIENWSVLLDLKIILKTFIDGFRDSNAY